MTWPEGLRDKHSGQRDPQSQRACHSPLPAKTLSHLVWREPREHLQDTKLGPTREGGPGSWRWGSVPEELAEELHRV